MSGETYWPGTEEALRSESVREPAMADTPMEEAKADQPRVSYKGIGGEVQCALSIENILGKKMIGMNRPMPWNTFPISINQKMGCSRKLRSIPLFQAVRPSKVGGIRDLTKYRGGAVRTTYSEFSMTRIF